MLNVKTKIIATIGPSSKDPKIILKMIKKGMNVARINMSHFTNTQDFIDTVKNIRNISKKYLTPIGILADLAGPKIRVDLNHIQGECIQIERNKKYSLGFSKNSDLKINTDIKFGKINSLLVNFGHGHNPNILKTESVTARGRGSGELGPCRDFSHIERRPS